MSMLGIASRLIGKYGSKILKEIIDPKKVSKTDKNVQKKDCGVKNKKSQNK